MQNYNFSIQYLLPKSTCLEVAFVGNKGTRLWGFPQYDVNPASKLAMGDVLLDPRFVAPAVQSRTRATRLTRLSPRRCCRIRSFTR